MQCNKKSATKRLMDNAQLDILSWEYVPFDLYATSNMDHFSPLVTSAIEVVSIISSFYIVVMCQSGSRMQALKIGRIFRTSLLPKDRDQHIVHTLVYGRCVGDAQVIKIYVHTCTRTLS